MRACIVVPLFDQPGALAALFDALAKLALPCFVVDDGSGAETQRALDAARADHPFVSVLRHARNRGKGAALRTGLEHAGESGFTHALLVDADGQHDPQAFPQLLAAARAQPEALVLGVPVFGADAPKSRLRGRKLSIWCARLETLSRAIPDPLCGLRCVPLAPARALLAEQPCGDRMEFDPQFAVRMVWAGTPIASVPVRVHYPAGGISHFHMLRDNARLTWMHTRLILGMLRRAPALLARRRAAPVAWYAKPERGARLALAFIVFVYRHVGRWLAEQLLHPIVAYFFLTDASARAASRAYLERLYAVAPEALGTAPTARHVHRHLLEFGFVTLDRIGFFVGRPDDFEMDLTGVEHALQPVREGQGVMVLGAHLGSFEAMRVLAGRSPVGVTVLMHEANARRIAGLVDALEATRSPAGRVRILQVVPGSFDHLVAARRQVQAGGVVAVLADRLPPDEHARSVPVSFLGGTARLPQGPFRLAALLGCPVVTMIALRAGPRRYRVEMRPLAQRIELPRSGREAELTRHAQAFADQLAAACRRAPLQWFNFFDYWEQPRGA